ncbi:Ubiquitin carboxyl-terminal hydrolase 48 [Phytophthora nicotianae]|nr:Ubiquitin carboxyl-terminal hydrolase 48 [Phytophthora nicotianae]
MVDRSTTTSLQSSTSTLSEDVEMWCREQEEMHSDIIVLLTETVMRCEKLQQENLDQLQNLMQLSVSSPRPSDRSSVASSYVGTERTSKPDHQDVLDVDAVAPAALASPTATSPKATSPRA